jgi:hypothetical protein
MCSSPVRHSPLTEMSFPFDLHVLGTPPAFILSQDQTLRLQQSFVPTERSITLLLVLCDSFPRLRFCCLLSCHSAVVKVLAARKTKTSFRWPQTRTRSGLVYFLTGT